MTNAVIVVARKVFFLPRAALHPVAYFVPIQKELRNNSSKLEASEQIVRQQHHEEVLSLQKEILAHEKRLEALTER